MDKPETDETGYIERVGGKACECFGYSNNGNGINERGMTSLNILFSVLLNFRTMSMFCLLR